MSELLIRRSFDKARKKRKETTAYYDLCFSELKQQLDDQIEPGTYDYKFNVMHNVFSLYDDFFKGFGPISPTDPLKVKVHFECPIIKMVRGIFDKNIAKLIGKNENLDTLDIFLAEVTARQNKEKSIH